MRLYKSMLIEVDEVDEVICNLCGESIPKDKFGLFRDHIHVDKKWGYHSEHDGEEHCFDICQSCYEDLKSKMTLPPFEK